MASGGAPETSGLPDDVWHDRTLASKFRIEEVMGRGGQAMVVAAHHLQLDERVALKFLLPEVAQSSAAVARFHREARAAAKIKNEHVVRIIDVCSTESGLPYIVMEYLDGVTLEQHLQKSANHRLRVSEAVDFILQASEALAEGHRQGIVHRDVKPANLFCVDHRDGFPMIKVLDFGISKIKARQGDLERTDRHEILGSPRYMSPEQIDASRDVDQRSDIWSLGVILYQALTGQVPFDGEFVPELWQKVRNDTPRSPSELRASVPPSLSSIVMKCLAKGRDERFFGLPELASALAAYAPERSRLSIARILHVAGRRHELLDSTGPVIRSDSTLHETSHRNSGGRWSTRTVVAGLAVSLIALIVASTQLIVKRLTAQRSLPSQPSTSSSRVSGTVTPQPTIAAPLRAPTPAPIATGTTTSPKWHPRPVAPPNGAPRASAGPAPPASTTTGSKAPSLASAESAAPSSSVEGPGPGPSSSASSLPPFPTPPATVRRPARLRMDDRSP